MSYRLRIRKRALRSLDRLHPQDRIRLLKKLHQLEKNPFSPRLDVRKLAQTERSYRLRVGDVCVIYGLDKSKRTIFVWKIGYRGGIY